MTPRVRTMRSTVALLVAAPLAFAASCGPTALDYCENSLREYYSSPDARHQAVVFDRSCGRSPSTSNLSVLPTGASIPDEPGNAYSVEGTAALGVRWEGASEIVVLTPAGARAVRRDSIVAGVRLRYEAPAPRATPAPDTTR